MTWKGAYDQKIRKYDFAYDPANRLTGAKFGQLVGSAFSTTPVNYNVSNLSYDGNGNILTMNQYGLKTATSSAIIDQLACHYKAGTNKLLNVVDAANDPNSSLGDFRYAITTKTGSTTDYTYDGNGNMTSDQNKKITGITYNILNLASVITVSGKGTIKYYYDGAGNKLRKRTTDITASPSKTTTTTTYIGGAVYQNDTFQFFGTPEGRTRSNADSSGWVYDYFMKDHLGNTRMMITDDYNIASPILEATSYYPFGLMQKGIELQQEPNPLHNKYTYNGKELQDDLGLDQYDYGARFYDAQIGRWDKIDGKAELYQNITPYAYAANQPTNAIDPDGKLVIFINGMHGGTGGKPAYWRATITNRTYVHSTYIGSNSFGIPSFADEYKLTTRQVNFDKAVMDKFNDHKQISQSLQYIDGSVGGKNGLPENMSAEYREGAGYEYGKEHVEDIINSLEHTKGGVITETLKIVTHSMGAAYGKGFVQAIVDWVKANPKEAEGLNIAVYDFAPFQENNLKPVKEATTYQFDNSGDWVVGYGLVNGSFFSKEEGVEKRTKNPSGSHSISDFMNQCKTCNRANMNIKTGNS